MEVMLVVVSTFALCFLLDKWFSGAFRSESHYKTGLSVRLHKYYAVGGLLLSVLGAAGVINGVLGNLPILIGGAILLALGIGLIVYYMTFGVYYDQDSILLSVFGKGKKVYRFGEIKGQQLYVITGGSVVVELYFADGRTLQLQSTMEGVYPFLDHAYQAWLRQTGRREEDCDFHDPENSLWFPTVEV